MYPIDRKRLGGLHDRSWSAVRPNVLVLGSTSLLTDVSAEMVAAILPAYFVLALGMSPLQFGLVDGLYQGAAAAAGLVGGLLADRLGRHRLLAACGYGLSAVCKLLLLAAGSAYAALAATIALDRLGKGIRTAPRDALISFSTEPRHLGLAFGVHRALDTAGALLGPLVAFAILAQRPDGYDVVFVCSFFFGLLGLAVLLLLFDPRAAVRSAPAETRPPGIGLRVLFADRRYRALLAIAFGLGVVAVPDSFLYLTIQRRAAMTTAYFPLLPVATAAAFMLLAIPAGRLSDAIGRTKVFVIGYLCLLAALAWLQLAGAEGGAALVALAALGAYYACTDGVLMAAAAALLPEDRRATGLGVLVTTIGLARLCASVLFGAAWDTFGLETALPLFAAALAVVLLFVARMLPRVGAAP